MISLLAWPAGLLALLLYLLLDQRRCDRRNKRIYEFSESLMRRREHERDWS